LVKALPIAVTCCFVAAWIWWRAAGTPTEAGLWIAGAAAAVAVLVLFVVKRRSS